MNWRFLCSVDPDSYLMPHNMVCLTIVYIGKIKFFIVDGVEQSWILGHPGRPVVPPTHANNETPKY